MQDVIPVIYGVLYSLFHVYTCHRQGILCITGTLHCWIDVFKSVLE